MPTYVSNSKKVKAGTVSHEDSCCTKHLGSGQGSDKQLDGPLTIPGSSEDGKKCCCGDHSQTGKQSS